MTVMKNKSGKKPAPPGTPIQFRFPLATQPAPFCKAGLQSVLSRAAQLENDPTLLAEDADVYKDKAYVNRVSQIFWSIVKTSGIPIMQIKKFHIRNMEKAFSKMANEQPDVYKDLCKFWGIVPEEHKAKKATSGIQPHRHLNLLNRWGYFDLFFSSLDYVVDLVVQKTYTSSNTMSKLEMAKYAHIFMLFIAGQCLMPYDLPKFEETCEKLKEQGIKFDAFDLREKVFSTIISGEKNIGWNAGWLYYCYNAYLKPLPNGAINLDTIVYFMELIEYDHKLLLKEFADMLSGDKKDTSSEKYDFKVRKLQPVMVNSDIRALKEKLFPLGPWESQTSLFLTSNSPKQRQAYRYAYNRFQKNGFKFGEGVETIKCPLECIHALSREKYTMYGYRYAWSPLAIRVSDPNELWMMRNM